MNSLALKRNEGTECHKDRSCFRPEHQAKTVIEPSLCYLTNRARRPTERSHAFASNVFSSHGKSSQRRINLRNLPGVTSATLGQKMTRKELERHCPFPSMGIEFQYARAERLWVGLQGLVGPEIR